MKKIILCLLIFFNPVIIFSQMDEGDSVSFKRDKWLVEQRMFPFSYIPADGLTKAFRQRDNLRMKQGFYIQSNRYDINNEAPPGWSSLGPTPGNYAGYSISGRCSFVKYDPGNPNIMYAGGACGGLWKSLDDGTTWIPLTDNLNSLSSGALAIDDTNNIIYYGTGESNDFQYVYYGYGIYKSNDGGVSFHLTKGLPFPCYVAQIAIKPDERNVVLAAVGSNYSNVNSSAGLYRSSDYGETWVRIVPAPGGQGLVCTDVAFSSDGSKVFIAGPQNNNSPNLWDNGVGFRISTDGGLNFISQDSRVQVEGNSKISICRSFRNRIYIITSNLIYNCPGYPNDYNIYEDIYRSDDTGNTFSSVWSDLVCPCQHNSTASCNGYNYQPWYNLFIKVHPNYPDIVYWGTTSLWKSTNGGYNSVMVGGYGTPVHPDFHDLDIFPGDSNKICTACDGGIYSSNDQGRDWSDLNNNLTLTQFYSLSVDPSNLDNMVAGSQDNGLQLKYPNYSHQWVGTVPGDVGTVKFNPVSPNYILLKVCNGSDFFQSSDHGKTFNYASSLENTAWLTPIVWHPILPNVVYSEGCLSDTGQLGIVKSIDYGLTWQKISSNFTNSNSIEQIAISNTDSSIMYSSAGSYSFWPFSYSYQALYKSTDGGSNWSNLYIMENQNPIIPKRYISKICINPRNENDVFITLSGFGCGHIWRSTDGGKIWKDYSRNLPDVPINDVVVFKDFYADNDDCVIATDCGVFITFDFRTWYELAEGLPSSIAMSLDMKPDVGVLRVATHGRGVWEINLMAESPNSIKNNQKLNRYYLYQNSPNPFNPSTKIRYQIPNNTYVTIKIYNVIGKEIATLVNHEYKTPGTYSIIWDASKYASGVYFYMLRTASYAETKKLVLLK